MAHRDPAPPAAKGSVSRIGKAAGAVRRFRRRAHGAGSTPSAGDILSSILASATDLLHAAQGFVVLARNDGVFEVVCTRRLRRSEVLSLLLGRAAEAIQQALQLRRPAAADARGHSSPAVCGPQGVDTPAVLCLPLDLGAQQSGVLCLLRRAGRHRVSSLDWEILQALGEQAALALGAATHQSALSALAASLEEPA